MTETVDNPSGIVVFDTETTGLDRKNDEIIQFSACDGQGKTLINTYLRPVRHTEWPEAMAVNGITPAMVADAPTLDEMADRIRAVLGSARTIIGYNTPFDLGFVSGIWKPADDVKIVDVMLDFARVYGQKDYRHGGYKWQKLVTAARYYGYEYKAHDSMNDVFATLFVHNQMSRSQAAKTA
jgi:DNA polymerase-3 subunit epsilon